MSPTRTLAPRRIQRTLWPTRSRARVLFDSGERREVERIAERLFGRPLRTWEYAGLVGAPDGALVDLYVSAGQLCLDMSDPFGACYRSHHHIGRFDTDLILVNESFHIHPGSMRGKGLGLRIFHRQLENAKQFGVTRIETLAGRRKDENGYYTWPRFGFDGLLPDEVRARVPSGLREARTVLDLMSGRRGRRWWREHGRTINVVFDMAHRSRSRLVFECYVRSRRMQVTSPAMM